MGAEFQLLRPSRPSTPLLTQIRNLFNRDNLCNNLYLSKYLKNSLTLPLYVIAEERRIANLIKNENELSQVDSQLLRLSRNQEWREWLEKEKFKS